MNVETTTLNLKICQLQDLKERYDEAKKAASVLNAIKEEMESELIQLLKQSELEKYSVPNVGTISRTTKLSYTTPKENEAKQRFFNYVKKTHGEDVMWKYVTVNANSLNSFCKEEMANPDVLEIPGLDMPTEYETLSFRKG